jgi:hypothetical protein
MEQPSETLSSQSQSQSHVTTDGQPASLSWNKAPIRGLRPDLDYCLTVAGLLIWGRPLWWEDGSAVCNCYWSSPAQSFLGPSPVRLVAIFYCLDSSLKVIVLSMWGALSHERSGLSFVRNTFIFYKTMIILLYAVSTTGTDRFNSDHVAVLSNEPYAIVLES